MTHPNVRPFMDLSTAHLTPKTRDWLDAHEPHGNLANWVAQTPYGWFLWCDVENGCGDFPADLIACMTYAKNNGADYILFDADADAVDDLPTYEDA